MPVCGGIENKNETENEERRGGNKGCSFRRNLSLRHRSRRYGNSQLNPDEIGQCVPGCEKIEKMDERRYLTIVHAGVGPIKVRFKFISTITEMDEPKHIHLESEGKIWGKPGALRRPVTLT